MGRSSLAPGPRFGFGRWARPGIIQVIGAIFQRRSFGASSEEVGLELPFFPLELFDFFSNAAMRFRASRWRLFQ